MTQRPPDFEPLAPSDPVPADTDEITLLGRRYTDTAAEIQTQAANLKKLAANSIDGWKGQAATSFQSHAGDLSARISQAHTRYAAAGQALTGCAGPMHAAQQAVYAAVWQAKAAQQQMTSSQPLPAPPAGSKPPTPDEAAAARRRQASYDEASTALGDARRKFDAAVADYQDAASMAAKAIGNAISHDGLKDSWWDRNFSWISKAMTIFAIVVAALAIVALILICPFSAALLAELIVWGAGLAGTELTAATVAAGLLGAGGTLGTIATIATAASAIFDGIAAGTGKESWTSFGLDLASLATFGLGEGAGVIVKSLAGGAEDAARAVAAGRAGREFLSDAGLPGWLYSAASRSGAVSKVLDWAGQGDKLAGAQKAAAGAREEIETAVKGAEGGNLATLLTMKPETAQEWAKLQVLAEKLPGVLRIEVPRAAAAGAVAVSGAASWGTLAAGDTSVAWTVAHWNSSDDAAVDHTIAQFRQMLSQVPAG